jgi:hypothetical protein
MALQSHYIYKSQDQKTERKDFQLIFTNKACLNPASLSVIHACNRKLKVSSEIGTFFSAISSTRVNAVDRSPHLPNAEMKRVVLYKYDQHI